MSAAALVPQGRGGAGQHGVAGGGRVRRGRARARCPTNYAAAGATIGNGWGADATEGGPRTTTEVARLRPGQALIGFLHPRNRTTRRRTSRRPEWQAFCGRGHPADPLRAQTMDALSLRPTSPVGGGGAAGRQPVHSVLPR